MQPVGCLHSRRLSTAAAMVAVLAAAVVPLQAHADTASPTIWAGVDSLAACQLASLTLSLPVAAQPAPSVYVNGPTFSISGQGTCTGAGGPQTFYLNGSGTLTALSCTVITSSNGGGQLQVVGATGGLFTVGILIEGPTAGPQITLVVDDGSLTGQVGVAQLSINAASLQACLQPGGTTSLNYTGTALFAP
jgi:hypothetical protein